MRVVTYLGNINLLVMPLIILELLSACMYILGVLQGEYLAVLMV